MPHKDTRQVTPVTAHHAPPAPITPSHAGVWRHLEEGLLRCLQNHHAIVVQRVREQDSATCLHRPPVASHCHVGVPHVPAPASAPPRAHPPLSPPLPSLPPPPAPTPDPGPGRSRPWWIGISAGASHPMSLKAGCSSKCETPRATSSTVLRSKGSAVTALVEAAACAHTTMGRIGLLIFR